MRRLAIALIAASCGSSGGTPPTTPMTAPPAATPAAASPHYGYVDAAAVSSDGRHGATAANDSLRVWDLATGKQLCLFSEDVPPADRYKDSPRDVTAMAFSGTTLHVGTEAGMVRSFDVASCRLVAEAMAHQGRVNEVIAAAKWLVTAGNDGVVRVGDNVIKLGESVGAVAVHPSGRLGVAFGDEFANVAILSPDGQIIAKADFGNAAIMPFSAALFRGDDLVVVSSGGEAGDESSITIIGPDGSVRGSMRQSPDVTMHGALIGLEDPATIFALSFDGAAWLPLGESPADPLLELRPDVVTTNKAQARSWAAHRAGDGWRVLYGDQDGNVAYLEVPGGRTLWKVDRTTAPKVSREECGKLFDHAVALASAATEQPSWELPIIDRLKTGDRDEAIADCEKTVFDAELRCNLGQTTYEGLTTCDYFRFHCKAAACTRPIDVE